MQKLLPAAALAFAAMALAGCKESPAQVEAVSVPVHFTAVVDKAEFEGGYGPNGYYEQYDLWLVVPPGTRANAGLTVGRGTPVRISHNGVTTAATGADIHRGDRVEVARDPIFVGYGAVQAPPGAPVYTADEVVILR